MLLIVVTIFIKLSVCFCASVNGGARSLETNVCTTPACLTAAKSITQNMNTSKKPCGNFYLFACGKFVKGAEVPRGEPYINPMKIIENEIKEKLKDDLQDDIKDNEPQTFQLLKSYYSVCLNSAVDTDEAVNNYQIEAVLDLFGGWPVLKGASWNESQFDWISFIGYVNELGLTNAINSFIRLSRKVEKGKTESYIVVDEPETGVDRRYLMKGLEEKNVKEYFNSMVNAAKVLGASQSQAELEKELAKSLKFEMELAKISPVSKTSSYTVEELDEADETSSETFSWYDYLNQFLPKDIEIDLNKRVFVNLTSFKSLLDLIEKTETRIVANYASWRVVQQLQDFLNDHVYNPVVSETGHPLWENCIDYLMEHMPVAMGALYVKKHFNKSSKTSVQEITVNLMENFKRFVSETKSMNELTKTAAQKKLDTMQVHVAYPDELLNDKKLDQYFKKLKDPSDNFLDNHLRLMAFNYHDKIERDEHFSKNDWVNQASAAKIDPIINYRRNNIIINAAIIQKEFFDPNVPNYLNYAGIGKVIGHEITHTFDNHGSKHDERGIRMDWWDQKAWNEFLNDTKCLAEQYEKYNASKRAITLNGMMALHENIADHGGIKVAYAAYEEWVKQNGEEPGLPGLPYTPRQLFWLNIAHTECNRIRKVGWDMMVEDVHSPGPFRILGPFSNMPEFARDFNCPAGSRMNPNKKCSFWWNRKL